MSSEYRPKHRERCMELHGEECQLCGSEENVVAHHIDGDRDNNADENLIPTCRSCHTSIHGGGVPELSERLPEESRTDLPKSVGVGLRPNIRVSHTLNGRVKDYADEHELTTAEAYRKIIEAGLEELEADDE